MKAKKPAPATPARWLEEIALAYKDAAEAVPFGFLVGVEIADKDFFHLAPIICFKFRGIRASEKQLKTVTKAVFSSYILTEEEEPEIFSSPEIAFAFCYLASHFSSDIIDEETVYSTMEYVEENIKELQKRCRS